MSPKELYNALLFQCITFLTTKDESFDDDLMCQLSEIIKANNLMKKFLSLGIRSNAKDLQSLVFQINTYYDNLKKKSRHSGILLLVMHMRGQASY